MRLTQSDLQAHLGVYRLTVGEWVVVSYAAFVLGAGFFSIGYLLAEGFLGNATLGVLIGAIAAIAAVLIAITQGRAVIVLEQDRIRYEVAVPFLSWSIPWSDVVNCEIVVRRAALLRVRTVAGTKVVVLPHRLRMLLT